MQILVRGDAVTVEDADDLRRFSVAASTGTDIGAALVGSDWGWPDPGGSGEVWILTTALRRAVEADQPPEWGKQFADMLAFAASKGWLSPSGDAIKAHVELLG